MTVPKWLIPVISVVAALAVGIAATLIGMRLAPTPPASAPVPEPVVETVPVLAPISTGDEAPVEPSDAEEGDPAADDEAPLEVSDVVSESEVTVPYEEGADDPLLAEYLRLAEVSPDLTFALFDAFVARRAGDPCAPRDGAVPAACPGGLPGVMLTDGELAPFVLSGQAFPPTEEEFAASGNPVTWDLWCDVAAGEGEVPFGIRSSFPGVFTITMHPVDAPDDVSTTTLTTSDAEAAEWQALVDAGASRVRARTCGVLDGIRPGTGYVADIRGVDAFGRTFVARTWFHADGSPMHPGLRITTIGDNLIFASTLGRTDERVEIRMAVVDGVGEPRCELADEGASVRPLSSTTIAIGRDEATAWNAPTDFTSKQVNAFAVAEGTSSIVCARWYPAGGAPVWEEDVPTYESMVVLQAPDKLSPTLSLTALEDFALGIDSLEVRVASAEGVPCGRFTWTSGESTDFPRIVCRGSALSTGGATIDEDSRLSTRGFSGDLVIRLTATTSAGSWETEYLVPAGDGACRGRCELPERAWYRVALADVDVHAGMCGSSFGDCEPPTRTVAAGTATFALDWEQGESNGASDWNVAEAEDRPVDTVAADVPRLDLGAADGGWTVTDPTVARPRSDATLRVRVDRAADFVVTLLQPFEPDGAPGIPATACGGGDELTLSGSTTSVGGEEWLEARFPGLCMAKGYAARVELTDEDGATSIYHPWDGPGATWSGTYFETGSLLGDASVTVSGDADEGHMYLERLEVRLNGEVIVSTGDVANPCLLDGSVEATGTQEGIELRTENTVTITMHIVPGQPVISSDEEWLRRCYGSRSAYPPLVVESTVSLADLTAWGGVRIQAPAAAHDSIDMRLTLTGIRPRG